jgi:hypothetical protein
VVLLIRHPEFPGGVRFLQGFLHVWETAVIAAVFALSMHALQPSGPGSASPVGTSLGIVATAGLPFSLVALLGGVLGFAMPLFMPALLWGKIAGGVLGLSVLWGVLLSGRGIAIRRGVSPGVGATAALAGLVVSLLVLALVLWMRLNPSDIQGVTPGQF